MPEEPTTQLGSVPEVVTNTEPAFTSAEITEHIKDEVELQEAQIGPVPPPWPADPSLALHAHVTGGMNGLRSMSYELGLHLEAGKLPELDGKLQSAQGALYHAWVAYYAILADLGAD